MEDSPSPRGPPMVAIVLPFRSSNRQSGVTGSQLDEVQIIEASSTAPPSHRHAPPQTRGSKKGTSKESHPAVRQLCLRSRTITPGAAVEASEAPRTRTGRVSKTATRRTGDPSTTSMTQRLDGMSVKDATSSSNHTAQQAEIGLNEDPTSSGGDRNNAIRLRSLPRGGAPHDAIKSGPQPFLITGMAQIEDASAFESLSEGRRSLLLAKPQERFPLQPEIESEEDRRARMAKDLQEREQQLALLRNRLLEKSRQRKEAAQNLAPSPTLDKSVLKTAPKTGIQPFHVAETAQSDESLLADAMRTARALIEKEQHGLATKPYNPSKVTKPTRNPAAKSRFATVRERPWAAASLEPILALPPPSPESVAEDRFWRNANWDTYAHVPDTPYSGRREYNERDEELRRILSEM